MCHPQLTWRGSGRLPPTPGHTPLIKSSLLHGAQATLSVFPRAALQADPVDGGVEAVCSKSKLTAEKPSTGQCWIPLKKDTPCPRAKEKPHETVGEAKSCLESNLIPTREAQRAQTKPCVHQDPGTPQETEPHLPFSV